MAAVWGSEYRARNELAHFVACLRRKVAQASDGGLVFIENVQGSGHRLLLAEVTRLDD